MPATALDRIRPRAVPPTIERARREPVPAGRKPMPMLAPHAADAVIAAAPERSIHRLTLDATLQKSLEDLARDRPRAWAHDLDRDRRR
jgi:penicillin-binding protein 1C